MIMGVDVSSSRMPCSTSTSRRKGPPNCMDEAMDAATRGFHAPDLKAGLGASMECRRSRCSLPRPTVATRTLLIRNSSTLTPKGQFFCFIDRA